MTNEQAANIKELAEQWAIARTREGNAVVQLNLGSPFESEITLEIWKKKTLEAQTRFFDAVNVLVVQ